MDMHTSLKSKPPMEKQERAPSRMHSPPCEPELEPMTLSQISPSQTLPPRREPELQSIGLSPNPSMETLSPRSEPDFESMSQNPPAETHSPPLEQLHYISPTESPPSYFLPHEEEEKNQKQNPLKPQTTPPPDSIPAVATNVDPVSQEVDEGRARSKNIGSGRRFSRLNLTVLKKFNNDHMHRKSQLGFRVCGLVFSLVSFSVLAADKERGWALDSFYRYKEFRYCVAVNVIAFAYSGFQSYDLAYLLTAGERKLRQNLRYYLDFSLDQMLTYLLLSASSSAAVRVDDWQSNWGKDEFPDMAKASLAFSFLAFAAFGFSSLISGYALYTLKST